MQSASLVLPPEPGLEGRLTGNGMVFVSPTYGLDDELRVCLGETDSAPLCRSASPHPSLGLHSLSMMALVVLHHFDYFFPFTLENHDAAEGRPCANRSSCGTADFETITSPSFCFELI